MVRKIVAGVAVVGLAFLLYMKFFGAAGGPPGMPGGMDGPMPVPAARAEMVTYNPTETFTGRLSAVAEAEVRPQVSGLVEKIHFKEGELVKAGQPLFTLDLRTYQAAAAQGAAEYERAKLAYERGVELRKQDAISQADLDGRKAAFRAAGALNAVAQVNLDHAVVKAPISGKVGRPDVTLGNVVNAGPGAPVMTTVQQQDPMHVDFDVSEQTYLSLLDMAGAGHGGNRLQLRDAPVAVGLANNGEDFPLDATLSAVDNRLGAETGSLRLRAVLPNPDGLLLPGLFARVKVTVPVSATSVLVNDRVIGTNQSFRYVWIMDKDGKAAQQRVVPGAMVGGLRAVSGLEAGTHVIVNGLQRLQPGVPVQPMAADMLTLQPVSASAVVGGVSPTETVSATE